MNAKLLFFCTISLFLVIFTNNDHVYTPVEDTNWFVIYQSVVRHALLAWQIVEHGIVEEEQMVEVIGRLALVKYCFEEAKGDAKLTIRHDSRFWVHLTDHILVHLCRVDKIKEMFPLVEKIIAYIKGRC